MTAIVDRLIHLGVPVALPPLHSVHANRPRQIGLIATPAGRLRRSVEVSRAAPP